MVLEEHNGTSRFWAGPGIIQAAMFALHCGVFGAVRQGLFWFQCTHSWVMLHSLRHLHRAQMAKSNIDFWLLTLNGSQWFSMIPYGSYWFPMVPDSVQIYFPWYSSFIWLGTLSERLSHSLVKMQTILKHAKSVILLPHFIWVIWAKSPCGDVTNWSCKHKNCAANACLMRGVRRNVGHQYFKK